MLPPQIPVFPLPGVVLFPNVFLPLHIFEHRYRAMVSDALAGDRIIGMLLLRPGYEAEYEGRPASYATGCAGLITHSEALPDGRYNIVLRGIEKFRVIDEEHTRPYRLARVEPLPELLTETDRPLLHQQRLRLEALLASALERAGSEPRLPATVADEDLINALAQYLDFEPIERQALLERNGVLPRCQGLIELLEMRTLSPHASDWKGRSVH